jgi:hypothetical protein
MSGIYNAVAGAATTVKEAVIGKDEAAEQAANSGVEPTAGIEGAGTSATEPYDKGNLATPLSKCIAYLASKPAIPAMMTYVCY